MRFLRELIVLVFASVEISHGVTNPFFYLDGEALQCGSTVDISDDKHHMMRAKAKYADSCMVTLKAQKNNVFLLIILKSHRLVTVHNGADQYSTTDLDWSMLYNGGFYHTESNYLTFYYDPELNSAHHEVEVEFDFVRFSPAAFALGVFLIIILPLCCCGVCIAGIVAFICCNSNKRNRGGANPRRFEEQRDQKPNRRRSFERQRSDPPNSDGRRKSDDYPREKASSSSSIEGNSPVPRLSSEQDLVPPRKGSFQQDRAAEDNRSRKPSIGDDQGPARKKSYQGDRNSVRSDEDYPRDNVSFTNERKSPKQSVKVNSIGFIE